MSWSTTTWWNDTCATVWRKTEALTLDPRSDEKLMAAQAEATLAVASALDGVATAIRKYKGGVTAETH